MSTRPTDDGDGQSDMPPGWDTNPSTWGQRLPIVGAAALGFGIASYLAAFQLDLIDTIWEPFFGDGSVTILTSGVSRVMPIPDGALGALGYLADAVTGVIGGSARWKRMPWLVVLFGLAVGPLGTISTPRDPPAGDVRRVVHALPGHGRHQRADDRSGDGRGAGQSAAREAHRSGRRLAMARLLDG